MHWSETKVVRDIMLQQLSSKCSTADLSVVVLFSFSGTHTAPRTVTLVDRHSFLLSLLLRSCSEPLTTNTNSACVEKWFKNNNITSFSNMRLLPKKI